jgi:hypothetical protein
MAVFRLQPTSSPKGDYTATWFDDEQMLWDDERLHKPQPIRATWKAPTLRLLKPQVTPVLFNPNALAVCTEVRDALADFPEIEFLPVEAAGTFFIMHVVMVLEAPPGCSLRRSPFSKNIVELHAFPAGYVPPTSFFRVAQPNDSAAGRAGFCMSTIYTSATGAQSVIAACRDYLEAISMVDGRRLS